MFYGLASGCRQSRAFPRQHASGKLVNLAETMAAQRHGRPRRLLAAAAANDKWRVLIAFQVIDFSVKQCKGYMDRLENVPFREVVIIPDIDHGSIIMIHKQYSFIGFKLFISEELAFHFVANQQGQNKRQGNKQYPVVDYKWNNILHDTFILVHIPKWSVFTPADGTQQRRNPVAEENPTCFPDVAPPSFANSADLIRAKVQ
jgi:hypothetical protein